MVIVNILRAVTTQYLELSYTKIVFIIYLKLKLNRIMPRVSLRD